MQQQAQDPSRQGYGAYNQGGYNQGNYNFPAAAFYGQYPGAPYGGNFQAQPVAFNRGRGRGAGFGQGPYGGRGGYMMGGAPGPYGAGFQNFGGRGGAMFGMRPRRKKPFVGGSLETQRQWEQQTLCCFFAQGLCKFGESCRFSHSDDGTRACQFGPQCRVGHGSRGSGDAASAPAPSAPTAQTADVKSA
mmetsp:Transcript_55759/g.64028  ORF Transcript_55759/g.64028 Transcript_55759/m.64028 type:complete len:189 (-) Transcript_55759:275-841(-)